MTHGGGGGGDEGDSRSAQNNAGDVFSIGSGMVLFTAPPVSAISLGTRDLSN